MSIKNTPDYLVLNRTFQYSFTCGLHKNTIIVISIIKVRIKKMGGPIVNISKDQEILHIKITKYVIGLNINRKLKDNIKLLLISDISPISNEIYFLKDNIAKINRAIITGNNPIVQKGYQYGELTSPLIKKTINQTIGKNASTIKITPKSNHNLANIFSILAFSSIFHFNQSQEINQNCNINIFGGKKTSDHLINSLISGFKDKLIMNISTNKIRELKIRHKIPSIPIESRKNNRIYTVPTPYIINEIDANFILYLITWYFSFIKKYKIINETPINTKYERNGVITTVNVTTKEVTGDCCIHIGILLTIQEFIQLSMRRAGIIYVIPLKSHRYFILLIVFFSSTDFSPYYMNQLHFIYFFGGFPREI